MTAPAPITTNTAEIGAPLWWLNRLHAELVKRQAEQDFHQRYVDGRHGSISAPERASVAFRRLMGMSTTNLCGLIVEATAGRLEVQGVRLEGAPDGDADTWAMWQGSDFDAGSELAITSALTLGRSFVSVEPNPDGDWPLLHPEDARQVVVAYAPGRYNERLAALKEWTDDWTGATFATLYLPDRIYRFQQERPSSPAVVKLEDAPIWLARITGDPLVTPNPVGAVPFFELRNRPRIGGAVMSEIADVTDDQDRANLIAFNALIAAEYGAFRQKWATGIEVPRDPDTGVPVEPFDVAVNRLLVSTGTEARFGDFNATDLRPYIDLYESTVRYMAGVSSVPSTYLLGQMANLSAEALAAAEVMLVRKCARRARHFEQAFEGAIRLAYDVAGQPGRGVGAEIIWANMEIQSRAQAADAAVKLTGGVPIISPQQAMEDLGYSETQRARNAQWMQESDALSNLTAMLDSQAALGTEEIPASPPPTAEAP